MVDFVQQAIIQPKVDDQASVALDKIGEAARKAGEDVEKFGKKTEDALPPLTTFRKETEKSEPPIIKTREAVDRLWASLDQNVAALVRYQKGVADVEKFEQQGKLTKGENVALLDALKHRYEDAGRAGNGFSGVLTAGSMAARAFGVSLTAAGIYTLGRRMLQSTDDGERALSELGDAFRELAVVARPVTTGISQGLASIVRSLAGAGTGIGAAVKSLADYGLTDYGRMIRAGGAVPDVAITGQVFGGNTQTPDDFFLRMAEARQRELDAELAARENAAEEAVRIREKMAADIAALDRRSAEIVNRTLDEETAARRKASEADIEQGRRAAAERTAIFNREMDRQAADSARAAQAARTQQEQIISRVGGDIARLVGSLGIGGGATGSALALMLGSGGGLGDLFSGTKFGDWLERNQGTISAGTQGFALGNVVGALTGGNQTNAGIVGGVGALAGSFLPIPGGQFIGAAIGSLIGGAFGPGPSNYTAAAYFGGGLDVTRLAGDKPNQSTSAAAASAAQSISAASALLKGYGVNFTRGLEYIGIGEQRPSYFRLSGWEHDRPTSTVGDPNELAFAAMRGLVENSRNMSGSMATALSGATSIQDFTTRAQFVGSFYDEIIKGEGALTSFQSEMQALVKSFEEASEKAREYGLDVGALTRGAGATFDENIRRELLALTNPEAFTRETLGRDAAARISAAGAMGGNVGQVEALNAEIMRQFEAQLAAQVQQTFDPLLESVREMFGIVRQGGPDLTAFESSMVTLVESFTEGAARVREYGLSLDEFTNGFARSFDQNVRMQLLSIQQPMEYAIELWKRDAQARLDAAVAIGGNVGQAAELNRALFAQMNAPAINSLTQLQNQIGFGSFSAAPQSAQYFAAANAYNTARRTALEGGDVQGFVSAASEFLPIARSFLGTSVAYGDISREVSSTVSQLVSQLQTAPDMSPVVTAVSTSGALVADEVRQLRDQVATMAADTRQTYSAILAAVARRE